MQRCGRGSCTARIEVVRIGGRVFIKQETVQALVEKGTVPALKGHELV
jgi:hypothetical protein